MDRRSLRRTLDDRMVGGVCGGLGRYFEVDSSLVRVFWVLFILLVGAGLPAYLLAWWVIPDETGQRSSLALALVLLVFVLPVLCFCCTSPFWVFGPLFGGSH
jgi:phage shock protein C